MKTTTTLLALAIAAIASPSAARDMGIHGTVSAGAATVPEYEGAEKQRVIPLAAGRATIGHRYVALEGLMIRANILESEAFEFGPIASLTFKRDADIRSQRVAALGTIKDAYEAGLFAAVSHPVGETDRLRFAVQGVHDVSKVHKGWIGSATASYTAMIGPKLGVTADVSATYASGDYARRYFSVTSAGSTASGLPTYLAKSGIKDVGASLTASYPINRRWSLVGYAGYKRLVGSIADSPVVALEGNVNQLSGGIGIAVAF